MNSNLKLTLDGVEVYFHPNDENGCGTVGFRSMDESYLLLSRALSPTEQDAALGLDGVHLELNDQALSCYEGVQAVSIHPSKIAFVLNEKGIRNLKFTVIEVCFELPPERFHQLKQVLRLVFETLDHFSDCS